MSALTSLLVTIKTQAIAVTGIGALRVFRGRKYYAEADTSLEKAVAALAAGTEGVFSFWKGPRSIQDRTKPGQLVVYGQLFLKRANNASSELDDEDTLAEALAVALSDLSAFVATRSLNVVYEIGDDGLEDGFAVYDFEMTYQVSACA
jgi:hypothetical protein